MSLSETVPRTIKTADDIIASGLATEQSRQKLTDVTSRYATAIPKTIADRITGPDDPLYKQFVPSELELQIKPYELADPIGDKPFSPVPGIVHRYPDRALLKPGLTCPIYCRFCFRREYIGAKDRALSTKQLSLALDWLATHPLVTEVILSGGDPLMLSDRRIASIIQAINQIEHITTIRIHTRVPVALPERVTHNLLDSIATDKALWMVVHINHAKEISPATRQCLSRIRSQAIPILGQSVLLKGVNDTADDLEMLFRAMIHQCVKPYYLHQLDHAPGTSHFHVPIEDGIAILRDLRGRISGLAWPTYVFDIPGGYGKIPLGPDYLEKSPDGTILGIYDRQGQYHQLRRK